MRYAASVHAFTFSPGLAAEGASKAQAVADALDGRPAITAVHDSGLSDHLQHEFAKRQMRSFSAIESLACYPSEMAYASVAGTELAVPEAWCGSRWACRSLRIRLPT